MNPAPLSQAHRTLAARAQQRLVAGDPRGALPPLQRLIREAPEDPRILAMLGVCLTQIGNAPGAIRALTRARELGLDDPEFAISLAQAHAHTGDFAAAEDVYADIETRAPGNPAVAAARAGLLTTLGRRDEAAAVIEAALTTHPDHPALLLEWSKAARDGDDEAITPRLQQAADQPDLPPAARAQILFEVCARHERHGRYDDAWNAATDANAILRRPYRHEDFAARVASIREHWTPDAVASMPTGANEDPRPVFIVGMPRSGTSLVEQIIQSHPAAFGAGELNAVQGLAAGRFGKWWEIRPTAIDAEALDGFAEDVAGALERAHADASLQGGQDGMISADPARITDKTPRNWRALGVLHRALPNARFIHCVRDATDTCLSCYFLDLQGNYPFKHDPVDLARYYRGYRELMDHWTSVLDGRILEVRYEDLTADPESRIPELIEFLGLDWDERCLRPHESDRIVRTSSNQQVREKIYRSSVKRWERFRDHLGPMREALGPYAD